MSFRNRNCGTVQFCMLYISLFTVGATTASADINDTESDLRVTGDVYIIDKLSATNKNVIEELFSNLLETNSEVFIKLRGAAISVVKRSDELTDVLRNTEMDRGQRVGIVNDIQDVLQVATRSVHIYVITEQGSDQVGGVTKALTNELRDRNVQIDVLYLQVENEHTSYRSRRQINFYNLIANVSGGSVIHTNKDNIGSALNLLKQSVKTALVHILRFSDHSPAGKEFRIPVDDTMTELIFRAQVERSNPVIIAVNPAGLPPSSRPHLLGKAGAGTVVGLLETNLTKPMDYGTWKITKLDFNMWDITVDGQSPVDFTHDFMETGPGGFGEFYLKGRPVIGNTYKLSITVPEYSKVQTVAMGMLFTRDWLMPIDMKPLKNVGGRRGKSVFYENFTIPNKDFMVGIEGRDKSGHMFRRIDPILISPVGLKLVIPPLTGVKFYQNETLKIPFTVINKGLKEGDVDVKIEDDKHFALAPTIASATVKPGQNFSGLFTIKAGLRVGETTTVTVTAKPYLGHGVFSQGQFEIRRFTVLDNNITTTVGRTPIVTTTSYVSSRVKSSPYVSASSVTSGPATRMSSPAKPAASVLLSSLRSSLVSIATANTVSMTTTSSPASSGNSPTTGNKHVPSPKSPAPFISFNFNSAGVNFPKKNQTMKYPYNIIFNFNFC